MTVLDPDALERLVGGHCAGRNASVWDVLPEVWADLRPLIARRAAAATVEREERHGPPLPGPVLSAIVPLPEPERLAEVAAMLRDGPLQDSVELVCAVVADAVEAARAVATEIGRTGVPVRLVVLAADGGIPAAINRAANAATGEWLLLLDAEALPVTSSTVPEMLAFAAGRPAVGLVGCRTLDASREQVLDAGFDFAWLETNPCWDAIPRGWLDYRLDPSNALAAPAPAVGTAAMLLRRGLFLEIGGWSERYLDDVFDGHELCHRVWERGLQVWRIAADVERPQLRRSDAGRSPLAWPIDAWLHTRRWGGLLAARSGAGAALHAEAIAAYRAGNHAAGQLALDRVRCLPFASEAEREAAWRDQPWYARSLADLAPALEERLVPVPPATRCDIAWSPEDGLLLVAGDGDDIFLVAARVEEDGAPVVHRALMTTAAEPTQLAMGHARLIPGEHGWRVIAARPSGAPLLCRIDPASGALSDPAPLCGLGAGTHASEWLPASADGAIRGVVRLGPTTVIELPPDDGPARVARVHDAPRLAETLSGRSSLIPWEDGGWLGLVADDVAGPAGARCLLRFAAFDADLRLAAISLPFMLASGAAEFRGGLAGSPGRVVVAEPGPDGVILRSLPADEVRGLLVPVAALAPDGPHAWPELSDGRRWPAGNERPWPETARRLTGAVRPDLVVDLADAPGEAESWEGADAIHVGAGLPPTDGTPRATVVPLAPEAFFAGDAADAVIGEREIGLGAIDARAPLQQVLREFAMLEAWASPEGAIVLHGVVRPSLAGAVASASRPWRDTDGWAIAPLLARHRPDLRLLLVEPGPDVPDGMLLVTGLDPDNPALLERFAEIVAEASPPGAGPGAALERLHAHEWPDTVPFDAALIWLAVGRAEAAIRRGDGPPCAMPVLVPAFDNATWLANMLGQLRELRLPAVVIDNASTSPAMRDLLAASPDVPVARMSGNHGPHIFLSRPVWRLLPELFAHTDPDLQFNPDLPDDFLCQLAAVTVDREIGKAGFALDVDDREAIGDLRHYSRPYRAWFSAWEWEERFWLWPAESLPGGDPAYHASIDTTFAVVNRHFCHRGRHMPAVRVAGRFTARHLPWYRDHPLAGAPDLAAYAAGRLMGQWDTTRAATPARDVLAIVPARGRPDLARGCVAALLASGPRAEVVLAVPSDAPGLDEYRAIPGAAVEIGPPGDPLHAANRIVELLSNRCRYLAVVPEDAEILTPGWDSLLAQAIWDLPEGMARAGAPGGPSLTLLRSRLARRAGTLLPTGLSADAGDARLLALGERSGGARHASTVEVRRIADPPQRPTALDVVTPPSLEWDDRAVVYQLASGGLVHFLSLIGNTISFCARHRATMVPILEASAEWAGIRFDEVFLPLAPEIATPRQREILVAEIGQRLGLPIATPEEIGFTWTDFLQTDYVLTGHLAGAGSLALPWGGVIGPGEALLSAGTPWPENGLRSGWQVAMSAITLTDAVKEDLARRLAPLPERYVGVHFRNTDYRSDLREVAERTADAARELGIADVLWATDDAESLGEITAMLPRLRFHQLAAIPSVREDGAQALHMIDPDRLARLGLGKRDIFLSSLADLMALIRSERFIPSGSRTSWTHVVAAARDDPAIFEPFFGALARRDVLPASP